MVSDDGIANRFGSFLERLTEQLHKLEQTLDEEQGERGRPGWSMGWKFSLGEATSRGTAGATRPPTGGRAPVEPVQPVASRSSPTSQEIVVEPRALAFFEVHEENDQLLVIADLPGLAEDALEASVAGEDLLVISVEIDGHQDRREILLPAPLVDLEVSREGSIITIRCFLEKS